MENVEAFIKEKTGFSYTVHTVPCQVKTHHPDIKLAYDFMFQFDTKDIFNDITTKTANGLIENHVVLEIK